MSPLRQWPVRQTTRTESALGGTSIEADNSRCVPNRPEAGHTQHRNAGRNVEGLGRVGHLLTNIRQDLGPAIDVHSGVAEEEHSEAFGYPDLLSRIRYGL